MQSVTTPNWRSLSRDEFAARVWALIPEANGGKPLPILTRSQEEYAQGMVDAALEFEVGPYDTACEIVDSYQEH